MEEAVLDAFRKAKAAHLDGPACYRAATDVWCDFHPEESRAKGASRVVSIVHEQLGSLRELARKLSE
jgi:hypothetical protein